MEQRIREIVCSDCIGTSDPDSYCKEPCHVLSELSKLFPDEETVRKMIYKTLGQWGVYETKTFPERRERLTEILAKAICGSRY